MSPTAVLIPSGETHGTEWIHRGELITINAELEWCEENCDLAPSSLRATKLGTFRSEAVHQMLRVLSGLLRENNRDELYIGSIGITAALSAFHCLGLRQPFGLGHTSPAPIRRVVGWIDQHLEERITLSALAALARCSIAHLIRLFNSYLRQSPAKYVAEQRLKRSLILLKEPGSDITDVALRCGFSSQCHFTHAFTKRYGEAPGAFRRKSKSVLLRVKGVEDIRTTASFRRDRKAEE